MAVNAQQVKFESDYGFNVPGLELNDDGSLVAVSVRGGDLLVSGTTLSVLGTNKTITLAPTGTGTVSTPRLTITGLADDQIAYSNNGAIEGSANLKWNGTTLSATNINTRGIASTDPLNELTLTSPTLVTVNAGLTAIGNIAGPNISATTKISASYVEANGTGNKIRFYFANVAAFPTASTWEGSIGYAADTKRIYLATSTGWVEVAQATTSPTYDNVNITGGSINGTTIGTTSPAAATFSSATVSAQPTLANQLTNKRYVDKQFYLALALAG